MQAKTLYLRYLSLTLIPGLRDSGYEATADDFQVAFDLISEPEKKVSTIMWDCNWERSNFVSYLQRTLIPDLRESGRDATADDFQTCVDYLTAEPVHPKGAEIR